MSKMKHLFSLSYKEIKSVRCLTLIAMLGAVSVVLGYLTIMPTETIKITFSFLPNEFVYYLFGPVVGAVFGAALDILTFIIRPTGPFFPGFTISAILTGLWFGIMLYQKPLSLKRIIITNVVYAIAITLLLNTYWLTLLYGYNYMALLQVRMIKAVITLPVESILLYTVIRGVEATGATKLLRGRKE